MKHHDTIEAPELGIDLAAKTEQSLFQWLLASLLFGRPIQQELGRRAHEELTSSGINSLDKLLATSWDELVQILDRAHYVRFDNSTATKLQDVAHEIKTHYGSVTGLVEQSRDANDLKRRLEVFKGIGPVTAEIFLRDVGPIWFPN